MRTPARCRWAFTKSRSAITSLRGHGVSFPGWTLRQMEVVFSEVNLSQVPGFLQAAEMQRPPWRLVECTLASSRQADGLGRVVLILEAVGKGGKPEGGGRTPDDGHRREDTGRQTPDTGGRTPDARRQTPEG